jgi:hypothetical protein
MILSTKIQLFSWLLSAKQSNELFVYAKYPHISLFALCLPCLILSRLVSVDHLSLLSLLDCALCLLYFGSLDIHFVIWFKIYFGFSFIVLDSEVNFFSEFLNFY